MEQVDNVRGNSLKVEEFFQVVKTLMILEQPFTMSPGSTTTFHQEKTNRTLVLIELVEAKCTQYHTKEAIGLPSK